MDTGAGMGSKSANAWGIGLASLGALCLIAAAVLYWAVVPDRKQLPGDTDTTRQFNGTAKFLLIPQALATGDLRSAVVTNTPVTAQRQVKVLATDGDAAQVSDSRSVSTEAGAPVGRTEATYAVDRRTLEATSDYPDGWTVVPHEGLTVSWPIGAEKQDYPAWINETQTTTTARYVREEDKAGVATYVFQADAPAAPIKDEQVLASLPKTLPVSVLSQLGSVLQLPPQVQAQLAQALPSLGNPVPINYTYESTSTIWVEPTSGVVVDIQREEIRKAGVGPAGASLLSVPVYDVVTQFAQPSLSAAADDAEDAKGTIDRLGSTLPLVLLIVGLAALVAGAALLIAGRRSGRPTRPSPPDPGSSAPGSPGPGVPAPG